jgi:hypothetical protein
MDEPTIKKYLTEDFAKAVKFYDDRASTSKGWYRLLSVYLIVASAGLTIVIAIAPKEECWRIAALILSASIGVATGLLAHFKYHENWLSYRGSWDALERERRTHQAGIGDYKSAADKDVLFVERVEAILAREGADFYSRHAKGEEPAKKPDKPK